MLIFIILYMLVIFFVSLKANKIAKFNNTKITIDYSWIAFIILIIFVGFRSADVGVDDAMHVRTFNEVATLGESLRDIEYSYILLSKLVQEIGGTYQLLFLIYAILSFTCMHKALNISLDKKYWVTFMGIFMSFLFIDSLIAMRQFLAMCLVFCAYGFFEKKKKTKAIISLSFAVFFHNSAIVVLPFFFIRRLIGRIPYYSKVIILASLYILQYIPWYSGLISLLNSISFIHDNYYLYYYLLYGAHIYANPVGIVTTLYILLFCSLLLLNKNRRVLYSENDKEIESYAFL